jgi:hypothetical protein
MRPARIVAALTMSLFGLGFAAAPAGAQADSTRVIAAAIPDGAATSPNGDYYLLQATPGQEITQQVKIANTNNTPVKVAVEPVDAGTSPNTGTTFGEPGDAKTGTARWITVSSPEITVTEGMERLVNFTVRVPDGTKPGQYLAGISASVPKATSDRNRNEPNQAAMSLELTFQRVIAVEIDVPGDWAPKLVVSGAQAEATPDGVSIGVHIANQGNAFARGRGSMRVASTNTDVNFAIDTFVSGTAIVMPIAWTDEVVPGTHKVQVDLQYDDGRRTSWNGDIVIAGQTQAALEQAVRNLQVTESSGFPWMLVLAGVLAACFIAGAVTLRRRGRRPVVKYRHV